MLWDGTYGFSSLSEKTRKSNRLKTSLQRQHFLLSYLKTLSVGPAWVRTRDLLLAQQTDTLTTEPTTHLTTETPFNFKHSPTTVQSQSAFRISSDNILVPSSLRNCFIFECEIVNQEFQTVLLVTMNCIIGAEDNGKQVAIMHHQSCQVICRTHSCNHV